VALRGDPRAVAAVPAVEDAFVDAARTAGLVAAGFIGLGLLFSLRLPAPARSPLETAEVRPGTHVREPVLAD